MPARTPWRSLDPTRRVATLSVVLAAAAAVLAAVVLPHLEALPGAPFAVPWVALVLAVVASEVLVVHLEARGDAHSLTFSEVPIIIGLILAAPFELLTARLVGAGMTLWLHRRQSLRKLSFNVAMMAVETLLVLVVHRAVLSGADPFSVRGWVAVYVATLTAMVFGTVAVTLAISLYEGRFMNGLTRRVLLAGSLSGVANTGLGMALAGSLWDESWLAVPVVVLAVLAYLAYRSYFALRQRYESLEQLHDFTRVVGRSIDLPIVARTVLSSARRLLRAKRAALLLRGPDEAAVLVVDDDLRFDLRPLEPAEAEALLALVVPPDEQTARLLTGSDLVPVLGAAEIKDAIAAPVFAEHGTAGFVVVADRLAEVSTFDHADVKLLETLVNHASVSLENGRLFRELEDEARLRTHQALHDALTGLPNRQLLTERLSESIAEAEQRPKSVAVLLIDLENFKEVNETLGHEAGDLLLNRISARIIEAVPEGAMLARFGGDEFALLLPDVADEAAATAVGYQVRSVLETPFVEQELALSVNASLGLAMYPAHGRDTATVLQRAEVALFNAKGTHTGVQAYEASRDPFTPQRLALAAELREAIGRRELEVHYQPKMDLRTRQIIGAEALVRWPHPRRGMLPPYEFIPAAERAGMVRPLAHFVLRTALAKCKAWRNANLDLSVAVNLSVRNLLDPQLPGDVMALLVEHGLPAEALTLEITESSIIADARRSLDVLSQFHEMGVRLSIDDFGEEYSTLSRLRHLPVSEIKVDRSFVSRMSLDHHDAAIVRNVVQLGHDMDLFVVAEGAESNDDLDLLTAMGCDAVQGYVISRPRPPDQIDSWLLQQRVAVLPPPPPPPPPPAPGRRHPDQGTASS